MRDYDRIANKITAVLFFSQSLSSAGFIAAFTVNALVAVDLTGWTAMAGVPGAIYVLGQAGGALVWGFSFEKIGRRWGLALGQIIGVIGSAIAITAVVGCSFLFFLTGLVMVGMARSAVDLGRFIAAEVHHPEMRGRAISKVVLGSTVGAIVGPLLVGPTGELATMAGLPELSGPYGVGFVVLVLAAILILSGLRPEPREIGRELSRVHTESGPAQETRSLSAIVRQPGVLAAMVTMVFAQMVMVVPMSITSVHMKTHQHPLSMVSLVISAHTLGMFAFSLITGKMTDRWGRLPVIILGASVMIISCLIAGPSVNLLPLVIALFLLGLGWNFAYVAGSTLLADQLSAKERAKTQGFNDLLLNLASAGSQVGSGVIYAFGGFMLMSLTSAIMAVVPLAAVVWLRVAQANKQSGTNI
ncbi:MAG: MFS transporter [Deltaproteobacteria bacterium]|nr:MFS transporter [Deltaproteobacteria bacterium]